MATKEQVAQGKQSFQERLQNASVGVPVREFTPLKHYWAVEGYSRKDEVEQFLHGYPSKGSDK